MLSPLARDYTKYFAAYLNPSPGDTTYKPVYTIYPKSVYHHSRYEPQHQDPYDRAATCIAKP